METQSPDSGAITSPNTGTRYILVTDWQKFHSWPSTDSLRQLVFYAKKRGLEKAVIRVGTRILINERAFFEWLEANPGRSYSSASLEEEELSGTALTKKPPAREKK